jgi:acetylornithine deacetylase
MTFTIDENFLKQTLQDMVQIDSRNPSLTPTAPGEAELGAYIARVLEQLGLEARLHELAPKRANVVGILKGSGGGKTLMLNGHLDTVGIENMEAPFDPVIRDGRLYGRGSQDMKASLTAMLAVAKAIRDAGIALKGDLLLTFVADEEHSSLGTEDIVKHYKADAAIVTEPTDLKLCTAHRGFIWYELETFGRAAHGSRYLEGIDANMMMGRFLAELDKLGADLLSREPHPLAGPPSLHAALLKGGSEVSTYAAHCSLTIERRTSPGETETQATEELQAIIDRLAKEDFSFKAKLSLSFERSPFEISRQAELVRVLEQATSKRLHETPQYMGASFWTDAALLQDAGIETVLIGPKGQGLHSLEEWVDLQSVLDLASILADTALSFCQQSAKGTA